MRALVIGATGGSGRAAVDALLAAGHEVTAFSRHADRLPRRDRLTTCNGDATRAEDVARAVAGHDVVIVTLGISESPVRVRLFGSAGTPMDVRSRGTRNVIAAMRDHGVAKLVVQTSFGVGETREKLGTIDRWTFALLLRDQIADTEVQERDVRDSGLEWVLVQPVHLTDDATTSDAFASPSGATRTMRVSRAQVGRFLAEMAESAAHVGHSVALSS